VQQAPLVRGRFENDRLTGVQEIFEAFAQGRNHFSGKIAFDRDGYLFLTLGDRQVAPEGNLAAHPAQDLSNHHGKIIRLHDDGRVPSDNPFVSRAGARPEIWSYGHRNVQGLAIDPHTGDIWANQHGAAGRRRAQSHPGWQELRLAGHRLRRELQHRPGDARAGHVAQTRRRI
jgi:glucose/arabinose dehydrogenase